MKYCDKSFYRIQRLNAHKLRHVKFIFKCDDCEYVTHNTDYMKVHGEKIHNKLFQCPIKNCGKLFSTESEMEDHKLIHIIDDDIDDDAGGCGSNKTLTKSKKV